MNRRIPDRWVETLSVVLVIVAVLVMVAGCLAGIENIR